MRTSIVARYGGEEFAIVLPETSPAGARAAAQNLRQKVEAMGIPHAYSLVAPQVTVSIGIATMLPSMAQTPALLIVAADNALYKAKQAGRNQTVFYTSAAATG